MSNDIKFKVYTEILIFLNYKLMSDKPDWNLFQETVIQYLKLCIWKDSDERNYLEIQEKHNYNCMKEVHKRLM